MNGVPTRRLEHQFLEIAGQRPLQPAFIHDSGQVTYQTLSTDAQDIANRLSHLPGWHVGDRVVLQIHNSAEYSSAFLGILMAQGIVVPLPPNMESQRRDTILKITSCKAIVTKHKGDNPVRIDPCVSSAAPTVLPGNLDESFQENLAAIFFTSGSTGAPKGVMLSHDNLISNAVAIQKYLSITSSDRALGLLPFFHAFGNSVLQSHLLAGATLVLAGNMIYPESVIEAMLRHETTSFSGVPDFFRVLLKHTRLGNIKLPALRYAAVAGGALRTEMAEDVAARIFPAQLFVMYGQTEATARLSYLPPEFLSTKRGSIGRGIPGVFLEVVDGGGKPISPGTVGQLRARGPGIMLGYWGDAEGTGGYSRAISPPSMKRGSSIPAAAPMPSARSPAIGSTRPRSRM
jgi:long-chain acyl-CoA synthetase